MRDAGVEPHQVERFYRRLATLNAGRNRQGHRGVHYGPGEPRRFSEGQGW